jgi:hypothetical protein
LQIENCKLKTKDCRLRADSERLPFSLFPFFVFSLRKLDAVGGDLVLAGLQEASSDDYSRVDFRDQRVEITDTFRANTAERCRSICNLQFAILNLQSAMTELQRFDCALVAAAYYTMPPAFRSTHSPVSRARNNSSSSCEFHNGTGGRVS